MQSSSSCNSISDRRNSCGSLEVLPNNSPAPSDTSEQFPSPPLSPKYLNAEGMIKALPIQTLTSLKRSIEDKAAAAVEELQKKKGEAEKDGVATTTTSGIESEMVTSTETDSEPPQKVYISEDENGDKILHGKSPKHKADFAHKIRSPKHSPHVPIFRVSGPNEKGKYHSYNFHFLPLYFVASNVLKLTSLYFSSELRNNKFSFSSVQRCIPFPPSLLS